MESPKKPNKISKVIRLRRLLRKCMSRIVTTAATMSPNRGSIPQSISFLKRTISSLSSDSDNSNNNKKHSSSNSNVVPKGHLAVCVGKELERFVIPVHYLGHQAFVLLLREAKEVFGFQQTGVLRIPCDISVFQSVLAMVEGKKKAVKNGGLMVKEQCRLSADDTFGCLLLDDAEMDYSHLHHSRHRPWSHICR
ncbi:protein SMALL AUXIN UP-REGULATED RNA 9-like [Syzygium oleosum]|uniref:protein SMALL AUXIN UP-REGULATED RNA 9-like n=1 Tax=Syzygium oleosum TaxID=219896 RepID=UPI0011D2BDD6|nr:protein SMALL AUXIN UP-REGULATED RNA 9-like [Syzygium oleosum]